MEIMKIDDEIKEIVNRRHYKIIQANLRKLRRRGMSSVIEIQSPEDGKKVSVRWNSDEFDRYLRVYEGIMKEYRTRLDNLQIKKKS